MNKRESRSSLGARQNDALFEFETCECEPSYDRHLVSLKNCGIPVKKKFLLANKHITKLNSTLSVRIEELNAQISMLYVENLRLRASEIALASQLKRERETLKKFSDDAEAASQNLTKHLINLRETHSAKHDDISTPPTPSSPKARRPTLTSPTSPKFNKIARPPNIPGIHEEEEPSSDDQGKELTPPRKKLKTTARPRLSTSKLPLPSRPSSPAPGPSTLLTSTNRHPDESSSLSFKARKTLRRQSGLLNVNTEALSVPRPASPAFGSPIRLAAGRAEEAEEFAAVHGDLLVVVNDDQADVVVKKEKRKGKAQEQPESEKDTNAIPALSYLGIAPNRPKEKKKPRDESELSDSNRNKAVKDSTSRAALKPIDSNVNELVDVDPKALLDASATRQFLRPVSPSGSGLPSPRGSSSPAPAGSSETDGAPSGGRERRTRRSVNYAEPKLNTKMRKPDPPPGSVEPTRKKRSSAAAVLTSNSTVYKPPSSAQVASLDEDPDVETRSSLEFLPPGVSMMDLANLPLPLRAANGAIIDPVNFPLPPRKLPGAASAMYSPDSPTRTTGSTISTETSTGTGVSVSRTTSHSHSNSIPGLTIKRKKSRPQLVLSSSEEEESGVEADAEYFGGSGTAKGAASWVNVEGRRKALPKRSAAAAAVAAIEDIRRHSMAF